MSLYGLILGISFLVGINFFSKHNTSVPKDKLNLFIVGAIASAIIGARLYHVVDQWSYYSNNLWQILATWNGGLGIFGGIIGTIIFILLFSFLSKISFLSITDSISPVIPLCQSIGRLGNFVNNEIPSWWIESCLSLVLFFILKKSKTPTAHYLIGYGLIRFLLEFIRTDTWQISSLKIGQMISVLFFLSGIAIISKNTNSRHKQY
ncbi:MAG: prolipoprotein diacylglyceryl transferase family protein [Candidatus Shapirobacteria bacterium]|jgi:phosphatidylglycerol:prolipoprotein diacylglycerol transferase